MEKEPALVCNCIVKRVKNRLLLVWSDDIALVDHVWKNDVDGYNESGRNGKWEHENLKKGYYKCKVVIRYHATYYPPEAVEYDRQISLYYLFPVSVGKAKRSGKHFDRY